MWTNLLIGLMAVGLLVAAARALSSTTERVIFAVLGIAGIAFVVWAQITGFVFPAISLTSPNWTLLAGALTFALLGAGIGTGSSRWSALGVASFGWFAWLLLGFSPIALALVVLGAVLLLVNSGVAHHWLALLACVSLFAGALVAANTVHVAMPGDNAIAKAQANAAATHAAMASSFQTKLDAMKANPGSFENWCKIPANVPACQVIKTQGDAIKYLQDSDAKQWAAMLKAGVVAVPGDMDTAAAAKSLADALAPFGGKINIGNDVDWSLSGANERGDAAFEQKTLTSVEQLLAYFDSAAGAVGKKNMLDHTPDALHDWFMAGKGILPIQPTIESCSQGNWGTTEDGKVVQFNKEICHSPGDVWWVPVGPDGTVYWAAATRAACSNPHMSVVIYPRGHAPAVCPAGSDRAGMAIGDGCYIKHPKPPKKPPTQSCPHGTFWSDKYRECLLSKPNPKPTGTTVPAPPTIPASGSTPAPTSTAPVPTPESTGTATGGSDPGAGH